MSESSISAPSPWRPAEIAGLFVQVETMLRAFGIACRARKMNSDDALVFLASGLKKRNGRY